MPNLLVIYKGEKFEYQIDDCDLDLVDKYKWHISLKGKNMYIAANIYKRHTTVEIHRIIAARMGLNLSQHIDHINQNTLDNRRNNLRSATRSLNKANRGKQLNNSSGYKGVCWDKKNKKWIAKIRVEGKTINLGRFKNIVEAAESYDQAAIEYFGQYACTNF